MHAAGLGIPMRVVALVVAAAFVAGACGDDDDKRTGGATSPTMPTTPTAPADQDQTTSRSDEDQIRSTLTTYLTAVANGDGRTACARLTVDGRRVVEKTPGARVETCEGVIAQVAAAAKPSDKAKLRSLAAEDIEVDVQGASATAKIEGATRDAKLVKSGERWLIDDLDAGGAAAGSGEPPKLKAEDVTYGQVQRELRMALARRYRVAALRCPRVARVEPSQELKCKIGVEGRWGTMTVKLLPNAYVEYRIRLGNRLSYGQSQITP